MNNLSGDTVTLSQLVRTEQNGLNVNRLLFAKFLVMTGRISEGNASEPRLLRSIPVIAVSNDEGRVAVVADAAEQPAAR